MTTRKKAEAATPTPAPTGTLDGFEQRVLRRALELVTNPELYQAEMEKEEGNPITLGPRVTDAASWAEDQVNAAKGKASKWLEKSRKPKKVPSAAALAAKGKYKTRTQESLDEDRWPKAMENVDEDLRLKIIENVGASGFSQGIERHKPKVDAAVKKLQPLVLALAKEIDAMPQDTDDQRENRMIAAKRGMQAIGKTLKGA